VVKVRKNHVISDDMHKSPLIYPGIVLRAGMLHVSRDVNGPDRILSLPCPLPCVLVGFRMERMMNGCGFGNGYI
jgi:hypothetical protein